ncbi:FMN-dependent NADH-azoreductase [Salinicola sp. DM10]|uniref:FMN-dependent NADH-azoreductase n=1 Tax=Salinicola sp. DM10 TaxID=2815721 RepID=UPI001A8FEA68|nr:NAD(P)H-dependent oxidoreductase [Salinicola sp. DM10]MCE3027107.1 NAD(P)H-dependent oxidoreductase [Salinicola sp. DM10]
MTQLLHLDASPRPGRAGTHEHGSLSRRLTHHFIEQWKATRPDDPVTRRDLGAQPPSYLDEAWIAAAFTPQESRTLAMHQTLAESDRLVDEVIDADLLVLGIPLYNYSYPAPFKAWIDQIVRLGRTIGFDPSNLEHPVLPLLNDRPRQAVILSSRGGHGLGAGGTMAHMNHLEASVRTALELIGIERFHEIAIEYQEEGGERLQRSIREALGQVEKLVASLQAIEEPCPA